MDIVEIGYIDTAKLDSYIRESIKRWEKIEENKWFDFDIETRKMLTDEFSTKAVYYCHTDYCVNHSGPSLTVSVDYNEVHKTGTIEIECLDGFPSTAKEALVGIFNEVLGCLDPATGRQT